VISRVPNGLSIRKGSRRTSKGRNRLANESPYGPMPAVGRASSSSFCARSSIPSDSMDDGWISRTGEGQIRPLPLLSDLSPRRLPRRLRNQSHRATPEIGVALAWVKEIELRAMGS
jgi:hypothetical protein